MKSHAGPSSFRTDRHAIHGRGRPGLSSDGPRSPAHVQLKTHHRREHPFTDKTEPDFLDDIFDYSLPPKIRFDGPLVEYVDGKPVEFDPNAVKKRDIFITDTTFRDGQQARPPYSIDQMVHLYDLLAKLGGPQGVIRQTEFFLYTKNDRETWTDAGHWDIRFRSARAGYVPTKAIFDWSAKLASGRPAC